MTAEYKVGRCGNGPIIESARNFLAIPLGIYRYEITGQEHLAGIRNHPSVVAFFPHTSHLDPISIRKSTPYDLRKFEVFPAAADRWYSNSVNAVFSSLMLITIPLDRVEAKESVIRCRQVLDHGFTLLFSPEGTRTRKPLEERDLRRGPADLALRGGYPIIPVRLRGFENIMPKGYLPRLFDGTQRYRVTLSFGKPICVPQIEDVVKRKQESLALTEYLKQHFLEM